MSGIPDSEHKPKYQFDYMPSKTITTPAFQGEDLTGDTFGRLTVSYFAGIALDKSCHERFLWACECSCGKMRLIDRDRLVSGATKSCNCLQRESRIVRLLIHGHSRISSILHPVYIAWKNMRRRCNDPKHPKYRWYGGRGIRICERWESFKNFLEDMGATWKRGLTLERKNSNGNYCPENVVWDTWKVQYQNKRTRGPASQYYS